MVNIFATASALLTPKFVDSLNPEKLAATLVKVEKEFGVKFNKSKKTFNIVGEWGAVRKAHRYLENLVSNHRGDDLNQIVKYKVKSEVDDDEKTTHDVNDYRGENRTQDATKHIKDGNTPYTQQVFKIKGNPKRGRHKGETVPAPVVYLQYQEEAYLDSDKLNMEEVLDDYEKTQTARKVSKADLKKILDKNTEQMGRPLNKRLPRGACLPIKKAQVNLLNQCNNNDTISTTSSTFVSPSSQAINSSMAVSLPNYDIKTNESQLQEAEIHLSLYNGDESRYRQQESISESSWVPCSDNQRFSHGTVGVKNQETITEFLNSLQSAVSASDTGSNFSSYPIGGSLNSVHFQSRGDNDITKSVSVMEGVASMYVPSQHELVIMRDSSIPNTHSLDNPDTQNGLAHSESSSIEPYSQSVAISSSQSVMAFDAHPLMVKNTQSPLVQKSQHLICAQTELSCPPFQTEGSSVNTHFPTKPLTDTSVRSPIPAHFVLPDSVVIDTADCVETPPINNDVMETETSLTLTETIATVNELGSEVHTRRKFLSEDGLDTRQVEDGVARELYVKGEDTPENTFLSHSSVTELLTKDNMQHICMSRGQKEEYLSGQSKKIVSANEYHWHLQSFCTEPAYCTEKNQEDCSQNHPSELPETGTNQEYNPDSSLVQRTVGNDPPLSSVEEKQLEGSTTEMYHEVISTASSSEENIHATCSNQSFDGHSRANGPIYTTSCHQREYNNIENVQLPQTPALAQKEPIDAETSTPLTAPSSSLEPAILDNETSTPLTAPSSSLEPAILTDLQNPKWLSVPAKIEVLDEKEITYKSKNPSEDISVASEKQSTVSEDVPTEIEAKPVHTKRKLLQRRTKKKPENQSSIQTDTESTESKCVPTSCQKPKGKVNKSRPPKKQKQHIEPAISKSTKDSNDEKKIGASSSDTFQIEGEKVMETKTETNKPKGKKEKRVYPCTECDYKGYRKKRLTEHMGRVHGLLTENCRGTQEKTSFSCDLCEKTFVFGKDLNRHKKIVHHGQVFFCEMCKKSYKSKYVFQKHMITHEEGYVRPMFPCQICERQFTTKFSLGCHIKSEHLGLKKTYICPTCGKTFSQVRSYRQHANVHAGIRPYVCEICGKAFTYDKSLKEHRYMHDNIRRFPCTVCGKAFRQRTCLLIHMKVHKETRDHICSSCGKGFTQRQSLLRHERTHTGDKPYACKICYKMFGDYAVIRKHILSSHKKTAQDWKKYVFAEQREMSSHYIPGGPGYVPRESCLKIREKNSATVLPPKQPGEPTVILGHKDKKETESESCNHVSMVSNVSVATYNNSLNVPSIQAGSAPQTADLNNLYQSCPPALHTSHSIGQHGNNIALETFNVSADIKPVVYDVSMNDIQPKYETLQAGIPQNFTITQTDNNLTTENNVVADILKAQGRQQQLGIDQDLFTSLASSSSANVISLDQNQRIQGQASFGISSVPITTGSTVQVLIVPEVTIAASQPCLNEPGYPFYSSSGYT